MDERSRAAELERRLADPRPQADVQADDGIELIRIAVRVRSALQPPLPRTAFTASARRHLLSRLRAEPSARRGVPAALRRLAFAAVSVLLAITLGTAGVAYAAQEALPGEALYGVKRGLESARWSITVEPEAQVELLSGIAAERVREVAALAASGEDLLVGETLEAYQHTLEQLQAAAGRLPSDVRTAALARAEARVQQHALVLEGVRQQVPEQAQAAIDRALERSSHSREVLDQLEQGGSPSDLAPGQNKEKERGPKRTPGPPETKPKP